ncbi:MAG TPA: Uma2 family endonuclease [Verrucomicrobiota bacterium]|nr:Uma2 family endonuclease [Verrucomicrobiota bacterium]
MSYAHVWQIAQTPSVNRFDNRDDHRYASVLVTSIGRRSVDAKSRPAILASGDLLSATEFLRRYERMPEIRQAELIEGIVHMASPVSADRHSEPDNLLQGWLCHYAGFTPGTRAGTNGTFQFDADNVVQPDAYLRIVPDQGGQATVEEGGYLTGAPELLVEVSARANTVRLRDKFRTYRRHRAKEFITWLTANARLDWLVLEGDEYRPLTADRRGVYRSPTFPGLWLNRKASFAGDWPGVFRTLELGLRSAGHRSFVATLRRRRAPAGRNGRRSAG